MAFGQKTGSLKNLKKSLAKGGGGAFIKYIPKNGSMNVRFIQEPEEWVNYVEHYDPMIRKSFPCNGETNCPGCASGERKSSRYLANAVDLDDNNRVIPLQMPKDLANRLVVKYEKWGTIVDRDIELSRSGEALDTVYDLEADAPSRRNLAQFQPHDLLKVLEDAYNNVFGGGVEDDDDDDAPAPKVQKGRARSSAAKQQTPTDLPEVDEDDDEDDEEETPKPAKKAAKKAPAKKAPAKKAAKAPEPEFTPDDDEDDDLPDDEPDVDPDLDDDDDEAAYDEETLRAMPLGALRKIAREEFGVSTRGKDQDALIEAIFDAGEEAGDEPPF